MRNTPNLKAERYRVSGPPRSNNGAFRLPGLGPTSCTLQVLVSDGLGWDHVSVSLAYRCPTWEEMCAVKDLFFRDDEVAMQLHPARNEYVNDHPYCLHLWRPQTAEEIARVQAEWAAGGEPSCPADPPGPIPLPPRFLVGVGPREGEQP